MTSCKYFIIADINRHKIPGKGVIRFLKRLSIPGCKFMIIWRIAKCIKWGGLLIRHYSIKYGYQIPLQTEIGEGLYLGHHGPVVINQNSRIGKNCNIAQNVTIGMENRGPRKGCPVIGDKVWIGAGATIVGKIQIGDDVLIAPNSFVNCDIPSHSVVFGNPCVIKHKEHATEAYI